MSVLASVARPSTPQLPADLRRHLRTARQLAESCAERPPAARSTGSSRVDRLLSGGLHRGQLVELIGRRSSGRFSVVLAALAAATARGDAVALVDLGDALDPQNAAAAGIVLERLLWARPTDLKSALIAAEAINGAGFPLIVVDLGLPPVPGGRGSEASWLRLAKAVDAQQSTLLVASPYRVSGTAATAVLRATDTRPRWSGRSDSPPLLHGTHCRLRLEKLRGRPTGATEDLELTAAESLSPVVSIDSATRGERYRDGRRLDRTG